MDAATLAAAGGFGGAGNMSGHGMPVSVPVSSSSGFASLLQPKGGATSQASVHDRLEQRRERSREHAKKSRDKKKMQFESLEKEANALRKENDALRALVYSKLPDKAQAIVGECCYNNDHKSVPAMALGDASQSQSRTKELAQSDFGLIESLTAERRSFVLTNPRLPDNPIVYASCAFCTLTGYSREQVVGRNCRFLQGPETDTRAVEAVRHAIASGRDATTTLLNFKADGTPFWNQFFVAALRDRQGNIVNYVGVQCAIDPPKPEASETDGQAQPTTNAKAMSKEIPHTRPTLEPVPLSKPTIPSPAKVISNDPGTDQLMDLDDDFDDDSIGGFDWSILAEALENDYMEEQEFASSPLADQVSSASSAGLGEESTRDLCKEENLALFARSPRSFTTKTVRSEVIDSLLHSYGDTSDQRFTSALDVLSSMYKASGQNACSSSLTKLLDANWRSLSRPAYKDCLGLNDHGEYLYTLEKMSFGMFKPPKLRCSVQRTMTNIEMGKMNGLPTLVPWSLRRELAVLDPDNEGGTSTQPSPCMLKSYDIAVSLTIESHQSEHVPYSPTSRLKALKVIKGYMLPDPNTPNRLTVWFTGGKLSPAPTPSSKNDDPEDAQYGGFEEWKAVFGGDYKKSWGESFRDMGAKLFLGAELPDGMTKDGTMSYTLHRPFGGHGKAYVDIIYLDEHILITKGNLGTIFAMVRDTSLPETGSTISSCGIDIKEGHVSEKVKTESDAQSSRKRKGLALNVGDIIGGAEAVDVHNAKDYGMEAKKAKTEPRSLNTATEKNLLDLAMFQSQPSNTAAEAQMARSVEHHSSNEGMKSILHSVESFFMGIRGSA